MLKPAWIRFAAACLIISLCAGAFAQDKEVDAAKAQVSNLFKIFKTKDWKSLYGVTAFSPKLKMESIDAATFAVNFAKGITESDTNGDFDKLFGGMTDIVTGQAVMEGTTAYVSTSCKIKTGDTTVMLLGIAKLIKVGDVWKWDLTFSDDSEKATSQRVTELLGAPATP